MSILPQSRRYAQRDAYLGTCDLVFESDELKVWNKSGKLAAVGSKTGKIFEVVEFLGKGRTAEVFKVRDSGGRNHAMKVVSRGPHSKAEVSSLQRLKHPNIVHFEMVARSDGYPQVFIIMELLLGGKICEMTKEGRLDGSPWEEQDARKVIIDLVGAVAHMHQNNVVHRDIKPDNCLRRDSGETVLCDFGESSRPKHGDDATRRTVGTPFFQPPEACSGRKFPTKGQDVWALGVTLYLLLFGRVPFGLEARSGMELCSRIAEDPLELEASEEEISSDCREFLQQLLTKDLTQRISVGEMVRHRWIAGFSPLGTPSPWSPFNDSDDMSDSSVLTQVSYSRDSSMHLVPSYVEKSQHSPSWSIKRVWSTGPGAHSHTPTSALRVIVIDDDFSARKHLLRRIIAVTEAGSTDQIVDECADPRNAMLEVIGGEQYAVIFIKMHMLSQTAEEFATAVRDSEPADATERVKIIGLSLRELEDQRRKSALESGLDEIQPLPPRISSLRRILSEVGWATKKKGHVSRSCMFDGSEYDEQMKTMDLRCMSSPGSPVSPSSSARSFPVVKFIPMTDRAPSPSLDAAHRQSALLTLLDCGLAPSSHVPSEKMSEPDVNRPDVRHSTDMGIFVSAPWRTPGIEETPGPTGTPVSRDLQGIDASVYEVFSMSPIPEAQVDTAKELCVLILDDDALRREDLENRVMAVSQNADVRQTVFVCTDRDQAIADIREGRTFAAIFIDESCDPKSLIQDVRECEQAGDKVPSRLVVMSPVQDRQVRLEWFECGADDVLDHQPLLSMVRRNLRLCGWGTKQCLDEGEWRAPSSTQVRSSRVRQALFEVQDRPLTTPTPPKRARTSRHFSQVGGPTHASIPRSAPRRAVFEGRGSPQALTPFPVGSAVSSDAIPQVRSTLLVKSAS